MHKVTYYTTIAGASAACEALRTMGNIKINRLQDLHKDVA